MTRRFFDTVDKPVTHIALSPSGDLVAGIVGKSHPMTYNRIAFWNAKTGELFKQIRWSLRSKALSWSAAECHLFELGEHHDIHEIWFEDDCIDHERLTELAIDTGGTHRSYLAVSMQGEVANLASCGVLRFIKQQQTILLRIRNATCLTFFDEGNHLAIGTEHGEILYLIRDKNGTWHESPVRIETGQHITSIASDQDWQIAVGYTRGIAMLDEYGMEFNSLPNTPNIINFANKRSLVIGTDAGITTHIITNRTLAEIRNAGRGCVTSMAITPDKRRVITNSTNLDTPVFSPEIYLI